MCVARASLVGEIVPHVHAHVFLVSGRSSSATAATAWSHRVLLIFVLASFVAMSEESAYIKCYRAVYNRSTTGLNTDARKNVASAALAATHNAPQATELAPNSRGGTRGGWHITHRQTCNTAQ
jgi:hypothetical protein